MKKRFSFLHFIFLIKSIFTVNTIITINYGGYIMFNLKKSISLIGCFIFCFFVFASCGQPEQNTNNRKDVNLYKGMGKFDGDTLYIGASNVNSSSNNALIKYDTLNVGIRSFSNGAFNPYFAKSKYDFYIINGMWEPLMKLGYDGQFYPNILKQLPAVSEDGTTYLFSLREDLFWQDGTKLTTKDIEFTYKFLMDKFYTGYFNREFLNIKNWSNYRDGISNSVEGIEIIDDYNFRITVETPSRYTLDLLNIYPLSFSYYGQFYYQGGADKLEGGDIKPFGNGVFKFLGYEKDEYVILENNPFYFKGKSSINVLNFKVVDTNEFFTELASGYVDIVKNIFWDTKSISDISKINFLSGYMFPNYEYFSIGINHNNPILKDLNVRKAIDSCIDKTQLFKNVSGNDLNILDSPLDKDFYNLSYNIDKKTQKSDKNNSIKLLEYAGWKKGASGIREKNGQKLEFKFLVDSNDPVVSKIFSKVKDELESIGISVVSENTDFITLKESFKQSDSPDNIFDLFLVSPDFNFQSNWFKSFLTNGVDNYYFYSNPNLDEILQDIFVERNAERSKSLYDKAYEIIKEDLPVIALFQNNQFDAYNGRIAGINTANIFKTFYYDEIILRK